jgi:hypothetical protein
LPVLLWNLEFSWFIFYWQDGGLTAVLYSLPSYCLLLSALSLICCVVHIINISIH